jgi:hypothetical protein
VRSAEFATIRAARRHAGTEGRRARDEETAKTADGGQRPGNKPPAPRGYESPARHAPRRAVPREQAPETGAVRTSAQSD